MKKNMGTADRMIRLIAAGAVVVLYLADMISGTTALVLAALAAVFVVTSFMSFCPLYLPFKFSTASKE